MSGGFNSGFSAGFQGGFPNYIIPVNTSNLAGCVKGCVGKCCCKCVPCSSYCVSWADNHGYAWSDYCFNHDLTIAVPCPIGTYTSTDCKIWTSPSGSYSMGPCSSFTRTATACVGSFDCSATQWIIVPTTGVYTCSGGCDSKSFWWSFDDSSHRTKPGEGTWGKDGLPGNLNLYD